MNWRVNMSCKYEKYIEQYIDGDLSSRRKKEFDAHLKDCKSCKNMISESIDFNNAFISAVSDFPFESNKSSIISEAKNMKKNFGVHSIMHLLYKFVLPAAAAIAACLLIYNYKPVYKCVSKAFSNVSQVITLNSVNLSYSNLNNTISSYLEKNTNSSSKIDTFGQDAKTAESHKIYSIKKNGSKLFVYINYLGEEFCRLGDIEKEPKFSYNVLSPALIVVENKNNKCSIIDFKAPANGESPEDFIRKTFPSAYVNTAIYDLKNNSDMKEAVNEKIKPWVQFSDMNLSKLKIPIPKNMRIVMNPSKDCPQNTLCYFYEGNNRIGTMYVTHAYPEFLLLHQVIAPPMCAITHLDDIITPIGNGKLEYMTYSTEPDTTSCYNDLTAFIQTKDKKFYFCIEITTTEKIYESKNKFINYVKSIKFK